MVPAERGYRPCREGGARRDTRNDHCPGGDHVTMLRPTTDRAALVHEIRDVIGDLPAFLAAPLFRKRHLTWGATADEVAAALPGDRSGPARGLLDRRGRSRSTRARSGRGRGSSRSGCRRAGFYSDDLLDNLGRPSATTIVAELQQLEVGQAIPMSPSSRNSERTAFAVARSRSARHCCGPSPTAPGRGG